MQSKESVHETAVRAIAESCYLQPEALRPDMPLVELGLDSMVILSILARVEDSIPSVRSG